MQIIENNTFIVSLLLLKGEVLSWVLLLLSVTYCKQEETEHYVGDYFSMRTDTYMPICCPIVSISDSRMVLRG